jgi:hypothetical protein
VLDKGFGHWKMPEGMAVNTYVLALRDGTESNLNLSLGQDIGGGGHVDQEVWRKIISRQSLLHGGPGSDHSTDANHRSFHSHSFSDPISFRIKERKNLPWTVALAPTAVARPRDPAMK